MNDFLSNLIERSFNDAPLIRPRVPSLFEPTAVEFIDEPRSSESEPAAPETAATTSATAPVRKLSPREKTSAANSMANASDALPTAQSQSEPDARRRQRAPAIPSQDIKQMIVPLVSSGSEKDRSNSTNQASESFSQTRTFQPLSRFLPAEQRQSGAPPTIRVTIGRVEVRAIHQLPTPAKRAKPVAPKLSLEDYLRKRERGSR